MLLLKQQAMLGMVLQQGDLKGKMHSESPQYNLPSASALSCMFVLQRKGLEKKHSVKSFGDIISSMEGALCLYVS